jgi:very-short-patch-repair endonuclease
LDIEVAAAWQVYRSLFDVLPLIICLLSLQVRRYELESRTQVSSVDIEVKVGEAKLVVEVDGPSHYAANRCAVITGLRR